MSRCFPFPPPGYEQKARPDGLNLTVKEKHKQKKHKDKKKTDKKERSEKKEKERSEGKHKEDKDRKQRKHKDKKDKKKDEKISSEEKNIVGQLGNQNGEKLGLDSKPSNGIQDHRILVELGKRVTNDGGATDIRMAQKIAFMEQRKTNLLGTVGENSDGMLAEPYDDIKNKREHNWIANAQNLKVHAKGLGNGFLGNFPGENQIKVESGSCQVDKVEKWKDGKDKNEHGNNIGKGDRHQNEDEDKNRKAEDKKRKKEKKKERSKKKTKQGASDGNFLDFRDNNPPNLVKESRDSQENLPKQKEPVLNGFLHENRIRPSALSRPPPSSHQVSQNGIGFRRPQNMINLHVEKGAIITDQKVNGKLSSSQSVIKNVRIMEPGRTSNNPTAEHGRATSNDRVVSNGHNSSEIMGVEWKVEPCQTTSNLAMMEQIVNNGHADDKFPTSGPLMENGRKMARQNTNKVVDMRGPDATYKMDNKEVKINGTLEGKKHSKSTSSASLKAKEKIGASMKPPPPHPDLKYLSQILTVPKVEWPQYDDDQEWLFGFLDSQAKRPKLSSSQIESIKPVWAEAMRLESADVTALPYVIPY